MPILDLQRRLREAGRIRIGQQVATSNGKRRPAKLDCFRLTSADRQVIEAAAVLYGGHVEPWADAPVGEQWEVVTETNALPVIIPPAATALSQWWELWSGGGCVRRCDGEREVLSERPCVCADEDERECKPTTRLNVMLRDLPGLGVWRLETHGWYAATELAGTVEICQIAASHGQLLPAVLRLEQRQVKRIVNGKPETRNFAVPTLDIAMVATSIGVVMGTRQIEDDNGQLAAFPSGKAWQSIPPPGELPPAGDVAEQIQNPRREPKPARSNSAEPIPRTQLKPRGAPTNNEPATTEKSISEPQMKKMRAMYAGLGLRDTDEQKTVTGLILETDISTHDTLTIAQASTVIDRLTDIAAGRIDLVLGDDAKVAAIRQAPDGAA